jgi:uncharacterized Zn finger protein (UPF0148 family)
MWVLKQCVCGSTEFEDDGEVILCAECGKRADFKFIKQSEVQGE